MFDTQSETEFLNFQSQTTYERIHLPELLLRINLFLGDKQFIHKRNVYDFMMFLGDAGGVYGSMIIIGSVLHILFSANEQSIQLLKYYFRVIEPKNS